MTSQWESIDVESVLPSLSSRHCDFHCRFFSIAMPLPANVFDSLDSGGILLAKKQMCIVWCFETPSKCISTMCFASFDFRQPVCNKRDQLCALRARLGKTVIETEHFTANHMPN